MRYLWAWIFERQREPEPLGNFDRTMVHHRFDLDSCSIRLRPSEIVALLVVEIDLEQLYKVQGDLSFTNLPLYGHEVELLPREVGYDALAGARYVLKRDA